MYIKDTLVPIIFVLNREVYYQPPKRGHLPKDRGVLIIEVPLL